MKDILIEILSPNSLVIVESTVEPGFIEDEMVPIISKSGRLKIEETFFIGVCPIREKEMFKGLEYIGIDFSSANIEYCKDHSEFNFLVGDFIKMNVNKKYDLVFSHAVIDHVYDIETFLLNLVKSCKKFAYINSYIGYFPNLDNHKRRWHDDDHCYYNTISVKQIEKSLQEFGLSNNQFVLRSQKANEKNTDNTQLVIEIDKTK
jgi:trans-aconitate methyltransferase